VRRSFPAARFVSWFRIRRAATSTSPPAPYAVKAPADGYTLLLSSSATITAGPAAFKHLAYDPLKGTGSSNHLAIEPLMRQANLNLLHVPYKGSGPALTDLLGSQVDSMMDQLTASIGHIKEGRIRALAISSLKRSLLLPDVPTLDESGVKGYQAATFTGLFVPAGTPSAVLDKLAAALEKARANEGVRERYRTLGVEMMDLTRAQFAAFVHDDYQKWLKVARQANIALE
jgi:tripartite-type tricarboxylate transporter receptor subunit TctC